MSIHIDALRDMAANEGCQVCDLVADEIEDMERAYALLFAECAKLRKAHDAARAELDAIYHPENQPSQYGTVLLGFHLDAMAALKREFGAA